MIGLMGLLACAPAQRPLGADEVPNIWLLLEPGEEPKLPAGAVRFAPVYPVAADPGAELRSLLTANWSPKPAANTLDGVLGLYGYEVHPTSGTGAPREPWMALDREARNVDDALTTLRARGEADRTALVVVWARARGAAATAAWPQPGALWWIGPRAPSPVDGELYSTIDVAPTLLGLAGATVPSDADGVSMAVAAGRKAVYGVDADGAWVVRSSRHRLSLASAALGPAGAAPTWPEACPAEAVLTDADGAPAADPEARAALYAALRAWRARLDATTARDRMGADHFDRLNAAQGYWQ